MLRPALLAFLLAAAAPLLGACEGRGDGAFGDRCDGDEACAEGLCVGGIDGEAPRCTRSCARTAECPEGWSCSGVTEAQVLVCKKGSATPFGD